jgi:hypothetical protein
MNGIDILDYDGLINIKLKEEFLRRLNKSIRDKFGSKGNMYSILKNKYFLKIPLSTFKARLKNSYKYYIDSEIIKYSCLELGISLKEVQTNMIGYKTKRSHNNILNPKLPIKITPISDMIIAHNIADGGLVRPNGRKPYFGYKQFDRKLRESYIEKLNFIFGEIKRCNKNAKTVYCPAALTKVLMEYYEMDRNSFLSDKARLPDKIKNGNKESLLAILIAFIIDEGYVDSSGIYIGLKNKGLVDDLKEICDKLCYDITRGIRKDRIDYIYLKAEALLKFHKDFLNLKNKFPVLNMGYKEEKLFEFIKRSKKPKRYIKGNKMKVKRLFFEEKMNSNEISKELNMTRQGVRYHINRIIKENNIKCS